MNFPKIRQVSNMVRIVRDHHDFQGMDGDTPIFRHVSEYPSLRFTGTVKIHGTNASIDCNGKCYSRTRQIIVGDDNYGFAVFASGLPEDIVEMIKSAGDRVFGEWCGQGINSGCGIQKLSRRWIIFSVLQSDVFSYPIFKESELKRLNEYDIYSIMQFGTYKMEVDFNHPEMSDFAALVESVESHCPVAEYFGVDGIGEGIVWTCDDEIRTDLWFKTKGDKHSATKVKRVKFNDIEKVASLVDFVEKTVTDIRLNQGIEALKADGKRIEMESTGDYLRWVFDDIIAEESELLESSGLEKKDIGKAISERARAFWFNEV